MMNTTTMPNSTVSLGNSSLSCNPPSDIYPALQIRYQIILPIFVTLGIIANTFSIIVATRPKLRALHFNLYVQVLSFLDLLGFIMRLPIVFDFEYCGYLNYNMAFYMTHFGWLIVNYFRALSSYVLVFMSLDRFIGIWFPNTFMDIKDTNAGKNRMIFTAIVLFLTTYIPWTLCLKVSGDNYLWFRNISITYAQYKGIWFRVFKHYSGLAISGFPSICIVGLNIGIIIGFFKKKIYINNSIGRTDKTAKKKFYHTIAVLTLNSSYAVCCFPYMVKILYVRTGICCSRNSYGQEIEVALLESLSSLWSISNMAIFFLLQKDYRNELIKIFRIVPLVKKYVIEETQNSNFNDEKMEPMK